MDNQVRRVLEDLIETLEDGRRGFAEAADRLAASGRNDIAAQMREYSEQRRRFSTELREMAAELGMGAAQNGSIAASVHRGWMALREAISSDQVSVVLSAAESGEEEAGKEYAKALDEELPEDVRMVLARQSSAITAAHDELQAMREQGAA